MCFSERLPPSLSYSSDYKRCSKPLVCSLFSLKAVTQAFYQISDFKCVYSCQQNQDKGFKQKLDVDHQSPN